MKKIILLFSILTFLFSEAEITNIQASQRTDGSQIVDITYDLIPDPIFEFFEIDIFVSLNDGNSWAIMTNVEGDFGDIIESGNGKILTWNFGQQFGGTYSDQIKIKIEGTSYAVVDNNNNQDLPFDMVSVSSGEYTFGENDETRTIDYDYEIMKYPVTDQDFVLYVMDQLNDSIPICSDLTNSDGSSWYECGGFTNQYTNWCNQCEGGSCPEGITEEICEAYFNNCNGVDEGAWSDFNCNWYESEGCPDMGGMFLNDLAYSAQDACCGCGGGNTEGSILNVYEYGITGNYPGDANYPAGNYNYIDFNNSKISWNGEIFEVEEGNVKHPVTGVTWFGAWAFATHYGMQVPDQYEWEKAARGNTGYEYPWGNNISYLNANFVLSGFGKTTAVDTYTGTNETIDSPSPFGVYDIAGNTWEIIKNDDNQIYLKGGSYDSNADELKSWNYENYSIGPNIGFRCIRIINPTNRKENSDKIKEIDKSIYNNKLHHSLKN